MKQIWTKDTAEYHGQSVDFPPMQTWPKPVQQPHPPVIVGGAFRLAPASRDPLRRRDPACSAEPFWMRGVAEGISYARCGRETEFWRSGLAQNPGDLAGVDPVDRGNLSNRHAVLHQGADTHELRARDLAHRLRLGGGWS